MSESPYAKHKPPVSSNSLYFKLEDGEEAVIRLATEPYVYMSEFKRPEGSSWSTRYAWVVHNPKEDTAQILQLSATTYKMIAAYALDEDYGDPRQYNIKLIRSGTGTDTTYTIIAGPKKEPITTAAQALVDKLDITAHIKHAIPLSQVEDAKDAPYPEGVHNLYDEEQRAKSKDVVLEDLDDDKPVNLDEIPF